MLLQHSGSDEAKAYFDRPDLAQDNIGSSKAFDDLGSQTAVGDTSSAKWFSGSFLYPSTVSPLEEQKHQIDAPSAGQAQAGNVGVGASVNGNSQYGFTPTSGSSVENIIVQGQRGEQSCLVAPAGSSGVTFSVGTIGNFRGATGVIQNSNYHDCLTHNDPLTAARIANHIVETIQAEISKVLNGHGPSTQITSSVTNYAQAGDISSFAGVIASSMAQDLYTNISGITGHAQPSPQVVSAGSYANQTPSSLSPILASSDQHTNLNL